MSPQKKKERNLLSFTKNIFSGNEAEQEERLSPLYNDLKAIKKRYSNHKNIAKGGMKEVFRVKDCKADRYVAMAKWNKAS